MAHGQTHIQEQFNGLAKIFSKSTYDRQDLLQNPEGVPASTMLVNQDVTYYRGESPFKTLNSLVTLERASDGKVQCVPVERPCCSLAVVAHHHSSRADGSKRSGTTRASLSAATASLATCPSSASDSLSMPPVRLMLCIIAHPSGGLMLWMSRHPGAFIDPKPPADH